ncbi:hypothetical protein P43SY_009578 [Pythium insidiosum]|uniref:HSF-type DNA-binding domain-containing protein n=1 Tax=Pythium insidiosum TaxID=114742 RepID=A0AAD5M5P3_PYTIN|nr:hypothetical protein P43SY_009578 [Pythium insidiosum]
MSPLPSSPDKSSPSDQTSTPDKMPAGIRHPETSTATGHDLRIRAPEVREDLPRDGSSSRSPASSRDDNGFDTPDGSDTPACKRRRRHHHPVAESDGSSTPLFLEKTYDLLDKCPSDLAGWSDDGTSFVVRNPVVFAEEIIPAYFKHRNFSSFVRQLNLYGFRKVRSVDIDAPRGVDPRDWWEFRHDKFLRGRRELLSEIKRRSLATQAAATAVDAGRASVDRAELQELRTEVLALREQVQQLNRHMLNVMQIVMLRHQSAPSPSPPPAAPMPSFPTLYAPLPDKLRPPPPPPPSTTPYILVQSPVPDAWGATLVPSTHHPLPLHRVQAQTSSPPSVGSKRSRSPPVLITPRAGDADGCTRPETPPVPNAIENPDAAVRHMSLMVAHIREALLACIVTRVLGFVGVSNTPAAAAIDDVADAVAKDIQQKLVDINTADAAMLGRPPGSAPSETSLMYRVEILKSVSKDLPRAMQDAVDKRLPAATKKTINRSLLALMVQKAQSALEQQMRVETAYDSPVAASGASALGSSAS